MLSWSRWISVLVTVACGAARAGPPTSSSNAIAGPAYLINFMERPPVGVVQNLVPGRWSFGSDRWPFVAGRSSFAGGGWSFRVWGAVTFTGQPCHARGVDRRRRTTRLPPRHEPFDPANARQVVIDARDHQHEDDDEPGEQHLLLDAHAEVAAREPFERHDEDVSAVEDRNRQEVHEAEVQADHRHEAEERDPAERRRLAGHLRDRDGAHQLFWGRLARDQPPHRLTDQPGVLDVPAEAPLDRFERARLDVLDLVLNRDADPAVVAVPGGRDGDRHRLAVAQDR